MLSVSRRFAVAAGAVLLLAGAAQSHEGGPPRDAADLRPACASCHVVRAIVLEEKDMHRNEIDGTSLEHLWEIREGKRAYGELDAEAREELRLQILQADRNSNLELHVPEVVEPGATFQARVFASGGAGSVVAVQLLDGDQRDSARSASAAGWRFEGDPRIDLLFRTARPSKRPFAPWPSGSDRRPDFVAIDGIDSEAERAVWPRISITWTLRAPDKPGEYPLAAVLFYGTETASKHGRMVAEDGKLGPRGGSEGHSGRLAFTPVSRIRVGTLPGQGEKNGAVGTETSRISEGRND